MSDNQAPQNNLSEEELRRVAGLPADDAALNSVAGGRMKLDPPADRSAQVSDASLDGIAGGRAPRRDPDPV